MKWVGSFVIKTNKNHNNLTNEMSKDSFWKLLKLKRLMDLDIT